MQEVNNTLPYDAQALPDIASALRSGEEEPKKVQEPLPEVPKGPLTVSEAYAFLGVPEADRGQLEKVGDLQRRQPRQGKRAARSRSSHGALTGLTVCSRHTAK